MNVGLVLMFSSLLASSYNVLSKREKKIHAFPDEPNKRIFSATTAFMASFAEAITWTRSFLGLLSEFM